MKLEEILKGCDFELISGSLDQEISTIEKDSRKVIDKSLFFCEKGYNSDGHDYIDKSIEKGSRAIIISKDIEVDNKEITLIKVKDTRFTLAKISQNFYLDPSSSIDLIGITGTNGKTSTSYFMESIYKAKNEKIGIIGTNGIKIGDEEFKTENTTPDVLTINKFLSEMVKRGIKTCVMEVSSHGLKLGRLDLLKFKLAGFTNLSVDHLDFHNSLEDYFNSKLFLMDKSSKIVVNSDDKYGRIIIEKYKDREILTIGLESGDLQAKDIKFSPDGVDYSFNYKGQTYKVRVNTPGDISVYNSLLAIGLGLMMDIDIDTIIQGIGSNSGIKGRFQVIDSDRDFFVIIDFAHTEEGLRSVLNTINGFKKARLISVFGAGGDRDRSKRAKMGQVAGELSDYSIITSDNPRTEDPNKIIDDIEVGMIASKGSYSKEVDRKKAIHKAIDMAEKNDIILLAGKGHENYIIIGKEKFEFDEERIVLDYLKEKGENN